MPTTYAIPDGRTVMAATLYAANGSTQTISNAVNGVSMQPDFVWVKSRQYTTVGHSLFDALRPIGVNSSLPRLVSNSTDAETNNGGLTAFVSNGFSLNNDAYINSTSTGGNMVAWQWNAGGSTVTNTSGSISAQVRANTTAGFSVVTWTGGGSAGTIGHGLGVTPGMIIVKNRSGTQFWFVNHASISTTQNLYLNDTAAVQSDGIFTSRGATTFGVGTGVAGSATNYVAYCFAAVAGYSAFGSYTGNGSANGPFTYLGFRPRFIMFKRTDSTGSWFMEDSSRGTYNVMGPELYAESSAAEATATRLDFLSNGFKMRAANAGDNASGGTYIYAAFAENPFKHSNAR
jgi:hypothetical protein